MSQAEYDIVTVGGGLGGAAVAVAMAKAGARVLVVERETRFQDRVRGEFMEPWGVAETRRLGIYDAIRNAANDCSLLANLPERNEARPPRLRRHHATQPAESGDLPSRAAGTGPSRGGESRAPRFAAVPQCARSKSAILRRSRSNQMAGWKN